MLNIFYIILCLTVSLYQCQWWRFIHRWDSHPGHWSETDICRRARQDQSLTIRGEPSHWSRSVQILGSYWWTPYCAGTKVYAITTHLKIRQMAWRRNCSLCLCGNKIAESLSWSCTRECWVLPSLTTIWPSEKHYFYLETCWQQLYTTLQNENIKLKVLEICSVSVRKDRVGAFSRCVMSGSEPSGEFWRKLRQLCTIILSNSDVTGWAKLYYSVQS